MRLRSDQLPAVPFHHCPPSAPSAPCVAALYQRLIANRATRSKRERANENRAQPSVLASVAFAVAYDLGSNAFESAGEEGAGDGASSKVDLRTLGYKRTKVSQRDYWGSMWGTMIRNRTHQNMKTNDGK